MTVRWRVLAFVSISLAFMVIMAGVMFLSLRLADQFVQRIEGLHGRLEVIAELDGNANNYARTALSTLILSEEAPHELDAVRFQMRATLAALTRVTRAEIASLREMDRIQDQLPAVENTRRIIEVFNAIELSVSAAMALRREGRRQDALDTFMDDANFRLTNELQVLIDAELDGEREEIARELADIAAVQRNMVIGAGVLAILALAAVSALGMAVYRSVVHPLNALKAGADALAHGQLDYRTGIGGHDEFSALSRTFDDMAAALQEQQTRLLESGQQLSAMVEARTTQLSQANERLQELDSRRSQFLADVSHQLRTPVTILRGEAEVALRGKPDVGQLQQALERVEGQAIELGQLLEGLINFARIESEGYPHEPEDAPIAEIIAEAAHEGRVLAEAREVSITEHAAQDDLRINADIRHLKQVLVIGLDNAIKHSPPGGTIAIETTHESDNVIIRIKDDGTGIAEGDRNQVFERFFRGRAEDDLHNQGLGIGLAIAREIVMRHRGSISLDNRPEGGAVLEIVLPLEGLPLS